MRKIKLRPEKEIKNLQVMQIMFYARNYLQKLNMQEKINFGKCHISTPALKASIFNKMLQS